MARGIGIPFLADVSNYIRGLRLSADETEALADALADVTDVGDDTFDTLADDADTAARELEDAFARAQRDVDDTFSDIADDAEDSFDRMRRDAGQAGTDMAEDLNTGVKGGQTSALFSEIGDEAAENLGEAFRARDPVGFIVETLTSLTPALGVAGIAIGAGAAIVHQLIQGISEEEAALRERIADLRGVIESELGEINFAVLQHALGDIIAGFDSNVTGAKEGIQGFEEALELAGIDVAEFNQAVSTGDVQWLEDAAARLADMAESTEQLNESMKWEEAARVLDEGLAGVEEALAEQEAFYRLLETEEQQRERNNEKVERGVQATRDAQDSQSDLTLEIGDTADETGTWVGKAEEAADVLATTKAEAREIRDAIKDIPSNKTVTITVVERGRKAT